MYAARAFLGLYDEFDIYMNLNHNIKILIWFVLIGYPSLGLIELNSYRIPLIHLDLKNGPLKMDLKLKNITVYNLKSTIVNKVQ